MWHDTSSHNGVANCSILHANGAWGIYARAGISWGYQDPRFPITYEALLAEQMYRTSYHVIYTDQDIVRQADNWYAVHPEIDVVPRVIDLEAVRPGSYASKSDAVWRMVELVRSRDGQPPIIYSNYPIINTWLQYWNTTMLNSVYYILAQYLKYYPLNEHPGPPWLPNRVDRSRVIMHQTTGKKPPPPGGVQSKSLDYDRWELGTAADMQEFIRVQWGNGGTPPPPPPLYPQYRVTAYALNVRDKPGMDGTVVGYKVKDDIVTVYREQGGWGKIDQLEERWVSMSYLAPK